MSYPAAFMHRSEGTIHTVCRYVIANASVSNSKVGVRHGCENVSY